MEARTFFDFGGIVPDYLILQNIERDSKKIQYYWDSRSSEAMCPFCGTMSNKGCKDYFGKPLRDMPQDGLAVYHVVRSKKYFCENPNCPHTRFVERLDDFAEESARKTIRFKKYCVERALENGCKPAEDALKRAGALVSNESIARYLKVESAKQIESNIKRNDVKVLAIDDINLRKGDGWVQATPCDGIIPVRPYFYVPKENVEERIRLAGLTESKLSDKAKELIYGVNDANDSAQSKCKENEQKKTTF